MFGYEGSTVEFFGRYLEVTVTFEEQGGKTLLVVHDQEALDGPIASGATPGMPETLEQLDELLVTPGASAGRSQGVPC